MKYLVGVLLVALAGCAGAAPFFSSTGTLQPGSTMQVVSNADADAKPLEINVYKPAIGDPKDKYTVSLTGPHQTTRMLSGVTRLKGRTLTVDPAVGGARVALIRVPGNVALSVDNAKGPVNITDITGTIVAKTGTGDIKIMVPNYAQASTRDGNITVYTSATKWPGTLHYATQHGTVELWINENAEFRVHLHTDRGTIFTDFDLRGTSKGLSETIDSAVGANPKQGIDVNVGTGDIRVLQLKPQV
jgi:hypothetical protein